MSTKNINGSIVIIIPKDFLLMCNQLGHIMGWGEESFTVPLCHVSDPSTILFYGLRSEYDEKFAGWFLGFEELPAQVRSIPGMSILFENVIIDISPSPMNTVSNVEELFSIRTNTLWGENHFNNICARYDLTLYREHVIVENDDNVWAFDPESLKSVEDIHSE